MDNPVNVTVSPIKELLGHKVVDVSIKTDLILFKRDDGNVVAMYHSQDCCESVTIEDIDGDIEDIIGTVVEAEEVTHQGDDEENYESYTWTFYKLGTSNGFVNIRWLGTSNGYYSENVLVQLLEMENDVDIHNHEFKLY